MRILVRFQLCKYAPLAAPGRATPAPAAPVREVRPQWPLAGSLRSGTFCLFLEKIGDGLSVPKGTCCHRDALSWGCFVQGTFRLGDGLSRGRGVQGTVRPGVV
jgi:hypothetical protein